MYRLQNTGEDVLLQKVRNERDEWLSKAMSKRWQQRRTGPVKTSADTINKNCKFWINPLSVQSKTNQGNLSKWT